MATTFDFTPLFRTAVGFDRMSRALESAARVDDSALSYPPYDIEQVDKDHYRIEMALAGFGQDDLEIVFQEGALIVKSVPDGKKDADRTYLHRGIARRAFERRFQLAEHIKVTGADLHNGMLTIDLERELPEALKPRKIEIRGGADLKEIKAA